MTQTTITRTDFRQLRTARSLAEFAERIGSAPYQIFRGRYFAPLFLGAAERPCFRVSGSLSDHGQIIGTWPDGTRFWNQGDRDRAMLAAAA